MTKEIIVMFSCEEDKVINRFIPFALLSQRIKSEKTAKELFRELRDVIEKFIDKSEETERCICEGFGKAIDTSANSDVFCSVCKKLIIKKEELEKLKNKYEEVVPCNFNAK